MRENARKTQKREDIKAEMLRLENFGENIENDEREYRKERVKREMM